MKLIYKSLTHSQILIFLMCRARSMKSVVAIKENSPQSFVGSLFLSANMTNFCRQIKLEK